MYTNLNDIQNELKNRINENNAKIQLWKNVKYPVKKNGDYFQNVAKNFENATYKPDYIAIQSGEYKLYVRNNQAEDYINCYELVRYLKDEEMIKKTENYLPKSPYLHQVYKYDVDDIKKAIQQRINNLTAENISLNKQLEMSQDIFNRINENVNNIISILNNECKEKSFYNSIGYMLTDYCKNRL